MPKTAVADGEVFYEDVGHGHPLIFISGLNGVGSYWAPQLPLFSQHFRVVSYDQRGTGQSDMTQRVFSVDQMAAECIALMNALNIGRAHIVGMSTGGAIGQTLAIEYPQRVAKLVLCSTWTHCDPWFRRLFHARRELYRTAGPEVHVLFHPLFLYSPDYVNTHDDEIEAESRRAPTRSSPVEVSIARIDALLAFDRRAGLATIKAPTLVMASDNDFITPGYFSQSLARAIPGARLSIGKGGGHSFTRMRVDEFNRELLEFLSMP